MDHTGLQELIAFGEGMYVQSTYNCFMIRILTDPGIESLISKVQITMYTLNFALNLSSFSISHSQGRWRSSGST